MGRTSILLVDDDRTLLELLAEHLAASGFQALSASNGASGLRLAKETEPALVVLDIMMPGLDGWQVCEHLRAHSPVPIIMLTAKGEEIDKLRGFRLGVDDYVTKPFSFAELTARIKAVLARASKASPAPRCLTSGDLTIDFDDRRVTVAAREVDLTPTEYRLLASLARHAHRTAPSEVLLAEVWGPDYVGQVEYVKRFIWTLRQKIEVDPGDPKHILTERGYGYRLE